MAVPSKMLGASEKCTQWENSLSSPASNFLSTRAFQDNRTNHYPLAATGSLLCLSQMLIKLNVLWGNKTTKPKRNRLHFSELHSIRLNKLPAWLRLNRRKQVPWPSWIDFIGYPSGLSKLLSVLDKNGLNKRCYTKRVSLLDGKLQDKSILPWTHSVSGFWMAAKFFRLFQGDQSK